MSELRYVGKSKKRGEENQGDGSGDYTLECEFPGGRCDILYTMGSSALPGPQEAFSGELHSSFLIVMEGRQAGVIIFILQMRRWCLEKCELPKVSSSEQPGGARPHTSRPADECLSNLCGAAPSSPLMGNEPSPLHSSRFHPVSAAVGVTGRIHGPQGCLSPSLQNSWVSKITWQLYMELRLLIGLPWDRLLSLDYPAGPVPKHESFRWKREARENSRGQHEKDTAQCC